MDALLALDMVAVAERGLGSVLADSPELFRHTFRRGELYNAAASSTRGVQCQLLSAAAATADDDDDDDPTAATSSSSTSDQLHWTYGPDVYRHLRAVRITLISCFPIP